MFTDELIPAVQYAAYAAGWTLAPRLVSAVERVGHRVRNRALRVESMRGEVEGLTATVRIAWWDGAWRDDLVRRLGAHFQEVETVDEGTLPTADLHASLRGLRGADLTFAELPGFRCGGFDDQSVFVLPKRVAHVERLDRPDPPFVRRRLQAVRARGITVTRTRDPRALSAFARDLYRPFVLARHGARARPTPTLVLELVLARGALLQLWEGTTVIGGALLADSLFAADCAEIVVIAASDPRDEIARTAPVVLAREAARAAGKLRCDHLGSAPFLNDGIFRRKQRYGTIPLDMSHRQDRVVVHVANTAGASALIAAEPFFALSERAHSLGAPVDVRVLLAGRP